MNNTQKEEELSLCSKCNTMKHIEIGNKECAKCVSESLEENGEEIKMEDCQVCNQYICKCPVKEFTPPTDSKLNQEYNNK